MNLSVEISLYPLQENYNDIIRDFLDSIDQGELDIRTCNMSTRIFGDYEEVMNCLNKAMLRSMKEHGKMVFVCKFLSGDARELKQYD